ncbi:Predicted membrane-bound metal-dependent hydrolase [Candidatus Terasakiella magnetica]|nr:Predicted membrane-bound metal-dependent hydrolase [Candidatus Terasakiella magnetica]
MVVTSHVILGACTWIVFSRLNAQAALEPLGLGLAAAGALLPDIDHPGSWVGRRLWPVSKPLSLLIGHRGLTHSLVAVVAGLVILNVLGPSPSLARWVEPLVIGYLSHLGADALTPAGVPLLWPFKRRFGLALCATGGMVEMLAVAAIAVATGLYLQP